MASGTHTGWNVIAGKKPQRGTIGGFRGRGRGSFRVGSGRGTGTRLSYMYKPTQKRQSVSTDSAGSGTDASKQKILPDFPDLLDRFKSMDIDQKLESIFICLHYVKSTNDRLLQAEKTVRELRETAHTNTQRINVLAYKSIGSEARQRRNNLIFWGIPESLSEDLWTCFGRLPFQLS